MRNWKLAYTPGPSPTRADREAIETVNPNVGPLDPKGKTQSPPVLTPTMNTAEENEEQIHNEVMNSDSFNNKTRQPTASWRIEDDNFHENEFEKGVEEEKEEHWESVGEDEQIIENLVKDHLEKDPAYYTKMKGWELAEVEDNQQKTIKKEKEKAKKESAWKIRASMKDNFLNYLDRIEDMVRQQDYQGAKQSIASFENYVNNSWNTTDQSLVPHPKLIKPIVQSIITMLGANDSMFSSGIVPEDIFGKIDQLRKIVPDEKGTVMPREKRHDEILDKWPKLTSWKFSQQDAILDQTVALLGQAKNLWNQYLNENNNLDQKLEFLYEAFETWNKANGTFQNWTPPDSLPEDTRNKIEDLDTLMVYTGNSFDRLIDNRGTQSDIDTINHRMDYIFNEMAQLEDVSMWAFDRPQRHQEILDKWPKLTSWKFANQELENFIYQALDQIENLLNDPSAAKQCVDLANEIVLKIFNYVGGYKNSDLPQNINTLWSSLYVNAREFENLMERFEYDVLITGYVQAAMSFFDEISNNIQEIRIQLQEIKEFEAKNSSEDEIMNDWDYDRTKVQDRNVRRNENLQNWEPVGAWGQKYTSWRFSNEIADTLEFANEVKSYVEENFAANAAFDVLAPFGDIYVSGSAPRDILLGRHPEKIELVAQIDPHTIRTLLEEIPGGRVRVDGHSFNFDLDESHVRVSLASEADFNTDTIMVDLKTGEVIDQSGAMESIYSGIITHVDPNLFKSRPEKMLEVLVKFSNHGLEPSDDTKLAMTEDAEQIENISPDQIREALDKILSGKRPSQAIRIAEDTGILQYMIPELSQCFGYDLMKPNQPHDLGTHLLDVLGSISGLTSNVDARLAALLHDVAKPHVRKIKKKSVHYPNHPEVGAKIAEDIMDRLRYPANRINYVTSLIAHHKFPDFNSSSGANRFLSSVGGDIDIAEDLLNLRYADKEDKIDHGMVTFMVNNMRKILHDNLKDRDVQLDELPINEYDVAHLLKIKPKDATPILKKVVEKINRYPQLNTRTELMELVKGMGHG